MGLVMPQNHIAFTTAGNIDEICKPLQKLGITYFSFVRSYKDGSHIRLSNNPQWTNHYYTRGFYNIVLKQVPDSEGNILWSNIDKYPLFYEASEFYDVDNGTVIVLNLDDITERYFFGSTKNNISINDVYLRRIDLFKRFILYFKESAQDLISKAETTKILVPRNKIEQDTSMLRDDIVDEFLEDIKINKYSIRAAGEDYLISNQEAKILSLIKCGLTSKEISNEVGLSAKTVEKYGERLKSNLALYSRKNLLSAARSNTLLDLSLIK